MSYWYISFSSADKVLGATVIQAATAEAALLEATERNLNPGGQALISEVPPEAENDPDMLATVNRLLGADEMLAQGARNNADMDEDERENLEARATKVDQARH